MAMNLLSIDEVAEKIGVSRNQVVKWLDAGRIPYVPAGGRRYVEAKNAKRPPKLRPGPRPRKAKSQKK